MKVALVHDQLNEFGGAERVLLALHEMFPDAPIYTAFCKKGSLAHQRFADADIRTSWAQHIPFFDSKLHSPLRFLAPQIWESFDFHGYDLVISSAAWFITKSINVPPGTCHICYCHTPPRYLWGLGTSVEWQKYWLVRLYGKIINGRLRAYDFASAQKVDVFIANSENTRARIKKFYKREAIVIYPPVALPAQLRRAGPPVELPVAGPRRASPAPCARSYFLTASRIVGGKGLAMAVRACTELGVPMKVVGAPSGWSSEYRKIRRIAGPTIEFVGAVSDEELVRLYSGADAFLATAKDEDFGITVVEAQLCGTPVIAYRGGGYLETVKEGRSGAFFNEYTVKSLREKLENFQFAPPAGGFNLKTAEIQRWAKKFSKERFVREMNAVIQKSMEICNTEK